MNKIFTIISSVTEKINGLISGLSGSTVTMIRQGYIALIIILALVAAAVGLIKGKDSARIKQPPLAPYTSNLFERDINMSREDGSFQKMMDDKYLKDELKGDELEKVQRKSKEHLLPKFDDSIFDSQTSSAKRDVPEMKYDDRPVDESGLSKKQIDDVRRIGDKNDSTVKTDIRDTADTTRPLPKENTDNKKDDSRIMRTPDAKRQPAQVIQDDRVLDN